MKRRSYPLVAALILSGSCLSQAATDGTIPSQSYSASEEWTIISPQMSSLHMNQPSVFNGYAILAGNAVHQVWDISNPYAPVFEAQMTSTHSTGGEAEAHQVSYGRDADGTFYFVTISGRGIDIWDLTNTTSPTIVSELILPDINYGDVAGALWGVCWQGNYIYAGATDNGLYVIDVTDPSNPEHVATMTKNELGGVQAGPLFALGDLLVITTPKTSTGIATVDISSPENPTLLDSIDPSGGSYIGAFYGKHAHFEGPFRSFDVTTDPRNITELGATSVSFPSEYMSFSNDYVYIGGLRGGTEGIWKYDISDLTNPVFEGQIVGRNTAFDDQFSCEVGNLIIIADDQPFNGGYVGAVLAVHDTVPDTTGPTIKWISVEDGSTDQSRSGQIGISFSEWIELTSVDATSCILRPVGGSPVAGNWGCTYTTINFGSDEPLLANTTYELVLPAGGITDLVGNALASTTTITFTTGEDLPGPPTIVDLDPSLLTELGSDTSFQVENPDPNYIYSWDFDDGNLAEGSDVTHTYTAPGRYNVKNSIIQNPQQYYEAELASLEGGVNVVTGNSASGGDYADFPGAQGSDVKIVWTIELDYATVTDLNFSYALAGSSNRPLNLVVNGGANVLMDFSPTSNWVNWTDFTAQDISLNAGTNTIELRADAGSAGPNIDLMHFTVGTDLELEAELATLEGGINISSFYSGASGDSYADYPGAQGSDVRIVWDVDLESPDTVDMVFRYALGSATARPLNLVVNGGSSIELPFPTSGGWATWAELTAEDISLSAGTNIIELRADAGSAGPNVDLLTIQFPDEEEVIASYNFLHIVHRPLTDPRPTSSKPLLVTDTHVWAVNPDADSISAVNTTTLIKDYEVLAGEEPKAIALAPDGTLWVTCRKSWEITVVDPSTQTIVESIILPYASQPIGIAFTPDASAAYVTLQATGQIIQLDPTTRTIVDTLDLGPDSEGLTPNPRGIAISSDSTTLYVTRFISPDAAAEVYEIDTASFSLNQTISLAKSTGSDNSQFARGLPNYLTSITISPDGARAWIPSKKDNIDRGDQLDGLSLVHDGTVRAITSTIDLSTGSEVNSERIDHDNGERCHDVTFSPYGDLAFVSLPGNHEVRIVDAYSGDSVNTLFAEEVPEGVLLDPTTGVLYVLNFLARSLSVFDVSTLLNGGSSTQWLADVSLLDVEPLSAQVLQGKKLFYDAESLAINASGYMSCASCHLDGSHDGRTYDFAEPMGEGFRNTIDLRGRAGVGHGRMHWTGNFDEIHDFEGQLRDLGLGQGLMDDSDFNEGTRSEPLGNPKAGYSDDLDALAAYVATLTEVPPSPHRNADGSLTADAILGQTHFNSLNCFSCHGGDSFTDSALGTLHDVGTIKTTSGNRLGASLTGIDTPTLRGIWATAPYLHDGSALTLRDVLTTANPSDTHGAISTLSESEIDQLVAYLKQIDVLEPAATAFTGVNADTFANFVTDHGLSGADALKETDPDKDGWDNFSEFTMGGTDPDSSNDTPQIISAIQTIDNEEHLELTWLRHQGGVWNNENYIWGEIVYSPSASTDLSNWDLDLINVTNPSGLPTPPAGYEWTTSRLIESADNLSSAFIRLSLVE